MVEIQEKDLLAIIGPFDEEEVWLTPMDGLTTVLPTVPGEVIPAPRTSDGKPWATASWTVTREVTIDACRVEDAQGERCVLAQDRLNFVPGQILRISVPLES